MSDVYTPTTEEVCDWYHAGREEFSMVRYEQASEEWSRWLAAVKANTLREAALRWQRGAWADTPRSSDVVADRMKAAQFTTKWLNEQADRIENGESA